MKHIKISDSNQDEETTYTAERITITKKESGYFNNGGFFTSFSDAFKEIVLNKDLNKLNLRLLLLILSYMGEKKMMKEPNVQFLMGVQDYSDILVSHKSNITKSFQKLEELGYIRRDKRRKDIHILINPNLAYNGKTKDYTKIWNENADLFGNPVRILKPKEPPIKQDWNSSLFDDLKDKN